MKPLLFLLLFTTLASSQEMRGVVVKIVDGDTFDLVLKDSGDTIRIRLAGVDCPERKQPFAEQATEFTAKRCLQKTVWFISHGKESFGRIVGDVILRGRRNLAHELVAAGLAWQVPKYSRSVAIDCLQSVARSAKLGLWSHPNPTPPWEFAK